MDIKKKNSKNNTETNNESDGICIYAQSRCFYIHLLKDDEKMSTISRFSITTNFIFDSSTFNNFSQHCLNVKFLTFVCCDLTCQAGSNNVSHFTCLEVV